MTAEVSSCMMGITPRRKLVPFVNVICQLMEQETSRWRTVSANPSIAGNSANASLESTSTDEALCELFLLKHSHFIGPIHDYFCQLEKNHACIHLAGRNVSDEGFRVATCVTHISPEPSPSAMSSANRKLVVLKDEEQLIYRCSLMCAQFAVLSAPSPPEGDSPVPSVPVKLFTDATMSTGPISPTSLSRTMPTNLTNEPPLFGTHGDDLPSSDEVIHKPQSSEMLSSGDTYYSVEPELVAMGNNDHDGFSMVTREMLCELVKQTFSQTEEQQLQHEHFIRINNNRRSKGEILAKELVNQLLVLENNAHSFYQPMAFFSRNCYDQWLQSEKKRIKAMLDKFWHFSLPRPSSTLQYHPIDYHRIYLLLLQKLIRYESSNGIPVTMSNDTMLNSILSCTARRLLKEFSLRYGVGDLYCQISYLEHISKNFSPDMLHIQHYTNHLVVVRESIPKARNRLTATRKEMDMLRSAVSLLHAQCDQCLTKVERIFPNDKEGIAALITLLAEVLSTQQSLFVKKVKPIREWLKKYLKVGINYRYERRKNIAEAEVIENLRIPIRLTPVLLNVMIVAIKDEMKDYRDNFQVPFERYLDVVALAKEEFYRLLCADVSKLCTHVTAKPESKKELSHQMLGLMYRMNELDCCWNSVITPEMQTWRNHFSDLAIITMDVVSKQMLLWISNIIEVDQWELLLVRADWLNQGGVKVKHSPSSVRPVSDVSSIVLPALTPVSIAISETSAFTGVYPNGVVGHVDAMTSPIPSSTETSYFSEDDLMDSSLHRHHGNARTGYGGTTVSFAQRYRSQPKQLLVTAEVHSTLANSSSIMTPVTEGTSASNLIACSEEEIDSKLLDSWNEAELLVPGTPDMSAESDHVTMTSIGRTATASSSYKETQPSPMVRAKLSQFTSKVKMPLGTGKLPKGKGSVRKKRRSQQLHLDTSDSSASDFIPPASVATAPGLKPWQNTPKHVNNHIAAMPTVMQCNDPLVTTSTQSVNTHVNEDGSTSTLATSESCLVIEDHRTLPISSSPVDVVVMLSRMASFCASMTLVLSPKLPVSSSLLDTDHNKLGHELSSEVSSSRQLSSQLRKRTMTIMKMFQHKLHRVMIQLIRLYADNLISMDVCGWSVSGAKEILGDTTYDNLRLRCEYGEIWGCRHEMERRTGLHPNGLPCERTQPSNRYEPITKSMCTRINNMEALIRALPQLETRLEKASGVVHVDQRHLTAHGYVSSEPNDANVTAPKDASDALGRWTSNSSNVIRQNNKSRPEEGFSSDSSHQLRKYLKQLKRAQLLLVSHRMNQLIEPALSLLLELQLPRYSLEKRMAPLTVWLIRHRDAFSSCLYPECFQEMMQCLWDLVLQDLEQGALNLRTSKKHIDKAMLIFQVLAHFINIIHWNGKGLPLEHLTSTDDYLVTVLSYYTKSTERLLQDFDMLNGQQQQQLDFSQAPIAVDLEIIRCLRSQLHSVKKTFTGKEFVDGLLSLTTVHNSAELSVSEIFTHQSIAYSSEYALELGQYLLDHGLLSSVTIHHLVHSTPSPSDIETSGQHIYDGRRKVFRLEMLYRFVDAEDEAVDIRKHQVLQALTEKLERKQQRTQPLEERGRLGTLLLISDILMQRSRHEKELREFVKSNKFNNVTTHLMENYVTCLCIVHL